LVSVHAASIAEPSAKTGFAPKSAAVPADGGGGLMKETADAGPENASKIAGIEKSMMRSLPSLGKILIKVDSL
jgi:hypothetical protein